MFGVALDAGNQIEPGLGGGASAGGVQRGPVLAQFEHLPGHQDAAARGGPRSQRVNHGAQRFGVRVVAVVQRVAPPISITWPRLSPAVSDAIALHGSIQIDARFQSHGEPGQRVQCVVRAQQVEREFALALSGAIFDVQASQVFVAPRELRIGARAGAEVDDAPHENRGQTAKHTHRRS
jgi:hypothetical protein